MVGIALEAGSVFAKLGWRLGDGDQLAEWKKERDQAQAKAKEPVNQQLGFDFNANDPDLKRYRAELDKIKAQAKRKEDFKAKLGADFDESAFRAFERETARAEAALEKERKQAVKTTDTHKELNRALRDFNGQMTSARNVVGLIKWPALITGAGLAAQAISTLTAGATALGSALAPLSGALAAYPALGSAAAQGMGTFKLATAGLGDGMKAASEGGKAWEDALKKLTPQQAEFIRHIKPVIDHVKGLQATAREGFLPGAERGILAANKNYGVLREGVSRTSKVLGELADNAGRLVGSKGFGRDLDTQMRRNDTTIRRAGEGGLNLANALRDVTIAAGPLVEWMTRMGVKFTETIEKQAHAGRESGKLAHFFDETRIAISRVARIGGDLAVAFFNIGKEGKPLGDHVLVNMVKLAEHFKDWTASARGKNEIADYFRRAKAPLDELGRLVHDAGIDFVKLGKGDQIAPLIRKLRVDILPAITDMIDTTTKGLGPDLVDALGEAIKLFTTISGSSGPLVEFVRLVGKVLGGINDIIDRVPAIGTAISSVATVGSLYAALRIGATLSGLTRVIGLIKAARGAGAVAAGAQVAGGAAAGAGAAGSAARGGAAGTVAAVVSRFPVAAIATAIVAAMSKPLLATIRGGSPTGNIESGKIASQATAIQRFNAQLERLDQIGDKRGADKLARQFDKLVDSSGKFRGSARDVDRLTRAAQDLADEGGTTERTLNRTLGRAAAHFADFRRTGSNNLHGLHTATADNMSFIKRRLGEDSREGKEALARNFRLARTAVRQSMEDGKVSVRDGLKEIQRLMRAELKQYGVTGKVASSIIKHGNIGPAGKVTDGQAQGAQRGGRIRRAIGGWIGARGMVSDDVVPIGDNALAAYGEYLAVGGDGRKAVLNRHQAPVADMALAAGGYRGLDQGADLSTIERALAPLGGLDRLFAAVTRPHYLASGGIIPVPGFPGESAASSVIPMILQIARQFGLTLTDAFGAGHKSPGHTRFGTAADFAGPDRSMDAAVRSLVSAGYLVGYDGRFGSQDWPGHGPAAGQGGLNAHLHVELGGKGGALTGAVAAAVRKITAPRTGVTGALGAIAQGALNAVTAGANRRLERAAAASLAVPVGGGGGGGRAASGQIRSWIAAGLRLAGQPVTPGAISTLAGRVMQESGGNPRAVNNWDVNAKRGDPSKGLLQTIGATFRRYMVPGHGDVFNPVDNVAAAVRYMLATYGHLVGAGPGGYARGGFLRRFAKGGKVDKLTKTVGGATAGLIRKVRPMQTDRSTRFDTLMGHVEAWDADYSRWERRFNVTDEELVDSDTGQVNVRAVKRKADELAKLIAIRARVENELEKARVVVRNIIRSYRRVITSLRKSLRHAKKKNRKGIESYVKQYEGRVDEWQGKLGEVGDSLFDTRTDLLELRGERREVLGTTAEARDTAAADVDAGGGDVGLGADVGGVDAGAEPAARPPTALELAQGVAEQLATFRSAQTDLLRSFGANATTRQQAFGAGGPFSGAPDDLALAAGLRNFGGAANLSGTLGAGRGGPVVEQLHVHYQQTVTDPATHVQQLRNIVENGVGG